MMCPWCGVRQYFDMTAHLAVCSRRPGVVVIPPEYERKGASTRPARGQNGAGAKGAAPLGGRKEKE